MKTNDTLLEMTNSLLKYRQFILERFEQTKGAGEQGDFYEEVKPFADEVKQMTDQWREAALAWLTLNPQRHLHTRQIDATAENLEMVSISAFFPNTSKKKFLDHVQSIEFVLRGLVNAVENQKN
ncbi:YppE family protein [Mesobacillus maritimus]|uniref:YppE family protein n=1 Tax=Mesobacillus maritimus TaxID=1643336 RepID=UPI00384D2DF0